MGSVIQCFLLHPTDKYRITLRRYTKEDRCPANDWCHNSDAFVGVEEHVSHPVSGDNFPHDDPRWPKKCDLCDYLFTEADVWQRNFNLVYKTDDGREFTLTSPDMMTTDKELGAPPGAMWECPWMGPGEDGRSYCVRTPGGDWHIDGIYGIPQPGRWKRTGTAPRLTVTPSIGIGGGPNGGWKYHGWLSDGFLREC
jgi:hypothetical protein